MARLHAPFGWLGGKFLISRKIVDVLPKHHIYVEVFGGAANLLIIKEPSPVEVYNDLDSGLVNFFRVLRDPEKFQKFYKQTCLMPYSREEYDFCKETWEKETDDVMRAVKWYVAARQGFGGQFASNWGYSVKGTHRGMSAQTSKYLSIIEMLPDIAARFMRVEIEHDDFRKVIPRFDTEETLFYCDPPYISATRIAGEYKHEMTDENNRDLVNILLGIKGNAILSGYMHEIYSPLEDAGWRRYDFSTVCFAAGKTRATGILGKGSALKKQQRTESVWIKKERTPALFKSDNFFAEKT